VSDRIDPEDFPATEGRDRILEKASHPSTWLKLREPRKCPLCDCQPKLFNGELICACMLPVVR
jgi:hypothetical protein